MTICDKIQRMKRIFIAINLPEQVKSALYAIEKEIQGSFPEEAGRGVAKWVKPENLHITLLFIGEVREEKIEEICEKVKQTAAQSQPFKIQLKKACYGAVSRGPARNASPASSAKRSFAGWRSDAGGVPRLIWAKIENNKSLKQITKSLGNQTFKPHITLARIKQWAWKNIEPDEQPNIEQNLDIAFEAKSIEVIESKLKPKGPEYNILKSFQFEN